MNFQFVIPCSNSELLNSEGDNYYVKHVYSPNDIPDQLRECRKAITNGGDPFYIFDNFDTFFSVLENAATTQVIYLMRTFDLLFVTADKMGQKLSQFLATTDAVPGAPDRNAYLNLIKMTMYLFVNTVKAIDQVIVQAGNMKKGKKNGPDLESHPDWEQKRYKFLVQIFNLMQLPLERLWNPPIPEEAFVNLLTDISYRTLEMQTSATREKHLSDTLFQIFGTAIKRFNHAITFPVRILQILRTCENAAAPIANGIHLLHEDYGISTIFSVLIRDIVESLTVESADTAISRNFSNFLTELSCTSPKMMIPHLSTLSEELLNCESHVLRNCILQIMGEAIIGELTSEELTEDLKEARDEFLENLLLHINDVSAHVRAKVLQIWTHMKEENAVPLSFQHKVLSETVDRLEDKTSSVRKNAVILIKSFLERNPFAAKLTLQELIKKHEEECAKMEQLSEVLAEERKKAEKLDEEWNTIIPELFPFVEENLVQCTQESHETQENYEDLVSRISGLLIEKKYKDAVGLVRKADFVAGNSELRHSLKLEEQCAYYIALLKSYMFLANGCSDSNEEFGTQIKTVQFLQDSIEFSKVITKAVPKIQEMLLSKTNSDVFEAVDLFTTGYLFGIKGTECGMRRMLYLVWSSDKEKRDAVSNAYKKVLFTTDETGRAHAIKAVQNLCRFFDDLLYGHYTAMECLVREWVLSDDIDSVIIQVLFERFTLKLENTTENESRQALQLLIMASNAKSSIASSNIPTIETILLSDRSKKDPRLYTGCLEFLLNSVDQSTNSKYYKRMEADNPLVQNVVTYFQKFFFHPRVPDFDKLTMKTIEFFYHLCQQPDIISQNIVVELSRKFKEFVIKVDELRATQFSQVSDSQQSGTEEPNAVKMRMPTFLLSRFMFLIGHMTMKEMIFLDIDVYNNMKFRQELTEEKKNAKKKNAAFNQNKRKTNHNMSATESLKRLSGTTAEPQQEPDDDLVGATAEDSIAELINHICEDVILYDEKSLLAKMVPYVTEICKYPSKYKDLHLQQAATLTLIRFMSVSSKFCETRMPFLMNILNCTKNTKIKCNIVVGLSDLTFRFPNAIEPWTGHFYSTLHESNDEIRLTAVKMLSHLILHEMIRVKGQIADLAMCIVDPHDEIKDITQQFFKEIANKSNILYNVLPDIISKLSDTNINIEEEKYRIIMRYILGLIQKDRQVESLVEKLCLRFKVTTEERQWRDISFCLSLLNYNEKTIKKLIDNIQQFKDKVQVDEVYQAFKTIITNTSKMAKPELKAIITEFESRLNECLEVRDDIADPNLSENAESRGAEATNANRKVNRKETKKKQPKKGGRKKVQEESESEESSAETTSSEEERRPAPSSSKPTQSSSKQKSRRSIRVIEESNSSDEEQIPQRKKGRNRK
ncbi:condensin complex subunit 1 [Eupeodes corollae]|uniref:condensin complex subunit 1 n=1 Tax=Eupeodes corollae TaxID=290404 RepID=UPI0024915C70|nr:condensin complex subunit 1 [Eupeodes corollae]